MLRQTRCGYRMATSAPRLAAATTAAATPPRSPSSLEAPTSTSPEAATAASATASTTSSSAGIFSTMRRLIAWNRTNAAAAAAAVPAASDAADGATASANGARGSHKTTRRATGTLNASSSSSSSAASAHALDVVEAVTRDRWTCRNFDPAKPIDTDTLKRVLSATLQAPTGFNLQGWNAVVVTDPAVRAELYKAALGQPQVLQAPVTVAFVGDLEPERNAPQALEMGLETGYYAPNYGPAYLRNVFYFMHGGPAQSMAAVKSALSAWYSRAAGTPLVSVPVSRTGYAWKQAMLPATTFVQLCTAAGWHTCMMEGVDDGAVKRVLGIPGERHTVAVLVSVGYATPLGLERGKIRSSRFAVSHTIRWNKF